MCHGKFECKLGFTPNSTASVPEKSVDEMSKILVVSFSAVSGGSGKWSDLSESRRVPDTKESQKWKIMKQP